MRPAVIKAGAVGMTATGMWLLVPSLATLFGCVNSIPACPGNVSASLPWSQPLSLPSEQAWSGVCCVCWVPACLTSCARMDRSCELQMGTSEATQLPKVPLALQDSVPWELAKQISEQARICSSQIPGCHCAAPLVYFSY